jgi:hypothetical protein
VARLTRHCSSTSDSGSSRGSSRTADGAPAAVTSAAANSRATGVSLVNAYSSVVASQSQLASAEVPSHSSRSSGSVRSLGPMPPGRLSSKPRPARPTQAAQRRAHPTTNAKLNRRSARRHADHAPVAGKRHHPHSHRSASVPGVTTPRSHGLPTILLRPVSAPRFAIMPRHPLPASGGRSCVRR